ncbi:MAG: DUF6913 domain-containing protein [Chitinophagales bacterium]
MSIINDIKNFFFQKDLQSKVRKLTSTRREMLNIEKAKTIGLVFNASKTENVMTITHFADALKNMNKKVLMLGYQNYKVKDQDDHRLFNLNDVNWYGKPTTTKIIDFQEEKVDILICAYLDDCPPLEYIAATSKAKFRVGAFNKNKTSHYELMININNRPELKYMLDQTAHFLKVINKE